jgi:glyoxalase family protein
MAAHWYWGVDNGRPGTLITYFERNPADQRYRGVRMGAGQTHHFAFAVADEAAQLEFREKLMRAGHRVTPVLDRVYFKSIYMNDPDGHIVEIATAGPGFVIDEDVNSLGTGLQLPPWLEAYRPEIEANLTPITAVPWKMPR